jgi:hypothetical protein
MTGQDFFKEFQVRIAKSYSRYVDSVKAQRLFKRALYSVMDKIWSGLDNQKPYDELRSLIVSDKTINIGANNKIILSPLTISSISTVSATILEITTISEHALSTGDTVTFSGVVGKTVVPDINSNSFSVQSVQSSNVFRITVTSHTGTYTADSGTVSHPYMLSNYLHLFSIACNFEDDISYNISSVSDTTPVCITLDSRSTLRDSDKITITGYSDTALNSTFYVKHHTDKRYTLYYNEALTSAVPKSIFTTNPVTVTNTRTVNSVTASGNFITFNTSTAHGITEGSYVTTIGFGGAGYNTTQAVYSVPSNTSFVLELTVTGTPGTGTVRYNTASPNTGGVVKKQYYEYASLIPPDQKVSVIDIATVSLPKFEITENAISIWPQNKTCIQAKIDYMIKPPRLIDPIDNTFDLENVYPVKFLYRVISEAVVLYSSPTRDQLLESSERREIQSNP